MNKQSEFDRRPHLTPSQLCFLLNYILRLPVVIGKNTVIAREIPVLVVASWTGKVRRRAEVWVEREMRRAHILPKLWHELHADGRPSVPPYELMHWIPGRKAA